MKSGWTLLSIVGADPYTACMFEIVHVECVTLGYLIQLYMGQCEIGAGIIKGRFKCVMGGR